jgi:hypothetical protein
MVDIFHPDESENVHHDYHDSHDCHDFQDRQEIISGEPEMIDARAETKSNEEEDGDEQHRCTFYEELRNGTPSSLPFDAYVEFAIVSNREEMDRQEEERRWAGTPLFHFTRLIRSHPSMAGKTARQAINAVERVFRDWGYSPCDGWEEWLEVDREDAHAEILDVWAKIRYDVGCDPLQHAWRQAQAHPATIPPRAVRNYTHSYDQFLQLVGWLQVLEGARPILLPTERIGGLIGLKARTVGRYCAWAIEDGFLARVKPARYTEQRAAEYLYDVGRVRLLAEQAEAGTQELFDSAQAARS